MIFERFLVRKMSALNIWTPSNANIFLWTVLNQQARTGSFKIKIRGLDHYLLIHVRYRFLVPNQRDTVMFDNLNFKIGFAPKILISRSIKRENYNRA